MRKSKPEMLNNVRFWGYIFSILIFFPFLSFSAPVVRNPEVLDSLKMNIGIYYDINNTNSIFDNFSAIYRVGIGSEKELGFMVHPNGILIDIKGVLKKNSPFIVSMALEGGICFNGLTFWGIELMLDLSLYDFLNLYLGGRGRYPANIFIDRSLYEQRGFQFLPYVGFEIFRKSFISIQFDCGLSFSWDNKLPQIWMASGIRYNF